jgi:hypothetical protein
MSMTRAALAVVVGCSFSAGVAVGADLGSLRQSGKPPVALAHAVTCTPRYDAVGFGKPELVVLLSDKALDAEAVRAGVDCEAHAFEQAVRKGDGALLALNFAPGLKLARVSVYGVGFTLGNDACDGCQSTVAYAGDRVKGRVTTSKPLALSDSTFTFDVQLDLAKPGPPPAGTPLPAGGGEPAKAFLAYVQAYQSGDYATLQRVLPPGKAEDEWGYYDDAAERREAILRDAEMEPKNAKVLEGTLLGKFALLIVEVPALWGGARQKALVGMSLVDGSWRVDDLSRDLSGTMFKK